MPLVRGSAQVRQRPCRKPSTACAKACGASAWTQWPAPGGLRPGADAVVVPHDGVEVHLPGIAALPVGAEVFEQELADRVGGNALPERGVDVGTGAEGAGVHRLKRVEDLRVAARVGLRRDVYHDELLDTAGVREGKLHGRLAPHGVAHQVRRSQAVPVHEPGQVRRHRRVVEAVVVGRAAVVALEMRAEDPAAERMPVAARAEQTVQDDQRRPRAVFFAEKVHGIITGIRQRGVQRGSRRAGSVVLKTPRRQTARGSLSPCSAMPIRSGSRVRFEQVADLRQQHFIRYIAFTTLNSTNATIKNAIRAFRNTP